MIFVIAGAVVERSREIGPDLRSRMRRRVISIAEMGHYYFYFIIYTITKQTQ